MRTSRTAICLLLGLCVAGCATTVSMAPETEESVAGLSKSADGPSYAMPTNARRIGRIAAPVLINGQGPFYFMVDTGATHTVITEKTVQRLGLSMSDGRPVSIHGVNGTVAAPTVSIDHFDTGALQFHALRLAVLASPVFRGLDGILGMDGLAQSKITADFIREEIRIARSAGLPAPRRHAVVRFELISQRIPVADARVGSVRVKAVIDTGGTQTLGNRALVAALAAHSGDPLVLPASGIIDATRTSHLGGVLITPRIDLGGVTISNIPVTFGDFRIFERWGFGEAPALLIGMDVLGALGELSIDFRRKELHLRDRR